MIKRADLQYLLREGLQIECCVVSNTYAYCMYKGEVNSVEYEYIFEEYGEENWIPLEACRKMKGFFSKKWLIITEVGYSTRKLEEEDKELAKQIELKDIYDYLGISKYYEFDCENNLLLRDISEYHELLLHSDIDSFNKELINMNSADKRFLFLLSIRLYKNGLFTDSRKIKVLEDLYDRQDFYSYDLGVD